MRRPLLPETRRYEFFSSLHNLHHPSFRTTRRLIARRFVFKHVSSEIPSWVKRCFFCQQCKIGRHQHTQLRCPPAPTERIEAFHVDIVEPLQDDRFYRYLFPIIDKRYPEAVFLTEASVVSCSRALLDWTSPFGICLCITSDRGRQSISDVWKVSAVTWRPVKNSVG